MRVTEAQIKKLLHESNLIEGYDDPEFDKQSLLAWRRLLPLGIKDLTHYDILKTQKIITLRQDDLQPDWRGYYRKIPVYIGGREAPLAITIPEKMDTWLFRLKEGVLKPQPMHIDFEHIHPFVDGNGRTGRMLMWWHQLQIGEELTVILDSKKQDYYRWFK